MAWRGPEKEFSTAAVLSVVFGDIFVSPGQHPDAAWRDMKALIGFLVNRDSFHMSVKDVRVNLDACEAMLRRNGRLSWLSHVAYPSEKASARREWLEAIVDMYGERQRICRFKR